PTTRSPPPAHPPRSGSCPPASALNAARSHSQRAKPSAADWPEAAHGAPSGPQQEERSPRRATWRWKRVWHWSWGEDSCLPPRAAVVCSDAQRGVADPSSTPAPSTRRGPVAMVKEICPGARGSGRKTHLHPDRRSTKKKGAPAPEPARPHSYQIGRAHV